MIRFFLLSVLVFTVGCDRIEALFLEEDLLQRPPSKRCSECHTKIYNQWKDSRHSVAWVSEEFIRKTKNRTKAKCLSCHAPLEIKPEEEPELRDKLKDEGVNCFSCHYRETTNSIHGPYKVFSPPHYSTYDPDYISSKICAGCHQKTYREWKLTDTDRSCQDCHMPAKKDRLIQKFPFKYFHSKKDLHNHSFPSLKAKERDFIVEIKKDKSGIILRIKNIGIPHTVPTAQQGNPKYYITLTGFLEGKNIFKDNYMLTPKSGLKPGKWKEIRFFVDPEVYKVTLTVERKLSWKDKREKVMEKSFYFD
ncbi:multiheme c-type cytochrome [Persephonella sp.]|uniref:multiheme c-type cytochrome n=1 Tax=Persephonella sp. TaxID=2060922 RepID=UPI0025FB9E4E|nr:multiheme c-type cytochrome [Persephonella sp.]